MNDDLEIPYPEEHRERDVAALLAILGGEPDPKMVELDCRQDEEFEAQRSHAA